MSKEKAKELIKFYQDSKRTMLKYIALKIAEEDWHGVADAAMDLRETDTYIRALKDSFNL